MNELLKLIDQWRRQTIKLGSAFKGQLYFQVGQMEDPRFRAIRGRRKAPRGVGLGRGTVAPLHGGLRAMPQKNFQKSTSKLRVFCIFLQTEMVSYAASARQFRLGSNHTIPSIAT